MIAKSKLNNMENRISEALINNEISYEDFTTSIEKEKNYCEQKKVIKMMKN